MQDSQVQKLEKENAQLRERVLFLEEVVKAKDGSVTQHAARTAEGMAEELKPAKSHA